MKMFAMIILVLIIAFAVSVLFTRLLIPFIQKKQMGQNIRDEGPEAHKAKAGTPSMGGVAIIGAVLIAAFSGLALSVHSSGNSEGVCKMIVILAGFLSFGALGFVDDYLKVIKKENEGLKVIPKFAMQFVIALVLAIYMQITYGTDVYIPIYGDYVSFGIAHIPFLVFVILAMVNAVNFTDGLDGLVSSVTVVVSFAIMAIAGSLVSVGAEVTSIVPVQIFCVALAGGLLGFLVFNKHPAKIFMGDTGSMALGGGITMAAVVMHIELLLPIIGIIYVLEVLSVCIQIAYFKATHGKRIFRMTPLHHHFELGGSSETSVVALFFTITVVACLIGIVLAFK